MVCELTSHVLHGFGDSFYTTPFRLVFNIAEKLAIQGTVGVLGEGLFVYFREIEADVEKLWAFVLCVILGAAVYVSFKW